MTTSQMEASLAELVRLVDTAGAEVASCYKQELKIINPATFIGKGKVEEIKNHLEGIDFVVFDDELSPAQNRNLSHAREMKVLDRTAVILDIFARRARTKEGKLQVELAQLAYRLPRLVGRGLSLMQQAGYIGNRGPGETKLEVDRRRVRERMSFVKGELKRVRGHREIHRRKREGVPISVVSLIGYTNAGKSTLMNALTNAEVFVEDKLFATLDPTVRRMKMKSGREILITDTVGFIRRLPHQLIESFKATLEEVERSDLLLHVIDVSEPEVKHQIEVVETVLAELNIRQKPCVRVYNKCDVKELFIKNANDGIFISSLKGTNLDELEKSIDYHLGVGFNHAKLKLPVTAGNILSEIYRLGRVREIKHLSNAIYVTADLPKKLVGRYKKYAMARS